MTSAGGLFSSTVLPDVTITLNEGVLTDLAHLVEVSIQKTREEAMEEANKAIFVKGDAIRSDYVKRLLYENLV